jgi:iron complex outermembrane receptor protein
MYAARKSFRLALLVQSSLLGLTIASPTMAQTAPAADDVAKESAGSGDIVVTARRRAETLNDVPLAITAISGDQLNAAGAQNLRDIAQLTPGLIVIDAGAQFYTTPTIRGLAQLNIQNGAIENNVSVFLNGVYLQNAGAINLSLLNLERVEVVKGPVSALYGRSAFAGAINYVSKRPSDELHAALDGTIGTSNRYAIAGSITGPLAENLRATIGGTYDSFGGTWKDPVNGNPAGGYDKKDFFASVEADIAPATLLSVNGYYGKDRFDAPAEYHLANNCAFVGGVAQQYCGRIPEGTVVEVPQAYQSGASGNDRQVTHIDATLTSKIGDFSTSLIAGYNNLKTRQFLEINNRRDGLTYGLVPGPGTINLNEYYGDNNKSEDYSFEGRISSPQYDRLRFSLGAFYYNSSGSQESNISLNQSLLPAGQTGINSFLANLWLTPGAVPSSLRNAAVTSGEQFSGFGEGEYKITPTLSLAQEIRYTSETKNIHVISSALSASATFVPLQKTYNYWNSRSTLRYKPNDDLMLYISAANGTKSGGFNGRATLPVDAGYDPEQNWTYELGAKGNLFDHRFTYEAAVYHIDASNLQILGLNSDASNPGQVVKNFGNAHNTGFELQTRTQLTHEIAFNLGFAYNDPRFGNGSVDAQYASICAAIASCAPKLINGTLPGSKVINIDGNALPRQSRYQVTSSLDLNVPLQNDWKLTGLIKYEYQSSQYYETANFSSFGPTHNLGVRIGASKGGVSATAWVENLINQTQAYSAFYNIRITDFVFETLPLYNDKRTAGITLSYRY